MRTLLALVGLVALIILGLVWAGFLNLDATPGTLPKVEVKGGQAPTLKADMGTVDVGTTNKVVEVPTVEVTRPGEAKR